jgi:hypothetical protein
MTAVGGALLPFARVRSNGSNGWYVAVWRGCRHDLVAPIAEVPEIEHHDHIAVIVDDIASRLWEADMIRI